MISVRDAHLDYETVGGAITALSGVDLDVRPGEVVAVLGANGSGKSTLARLCNGLLTPTAGTVHVDGIDTGDEARVWDVRSRVGLVLQDPDDQIVGTSVEADVAFGPENLGVDPVEIAERITWALDVVGLADLRRREPHLLSQGQKQRLAIAGALAMRPSYLVLDEPTSMLDPRGRSDIGDVIGRLVSSEGTGVLHVTHRLEELVRADRVLVLADGAAVFRGTAQELLSDPGLIDGAGVSLPAVWRVAQRLREAGIPVPVAALDPEEIARCLPC